MIRCVGNYDQLPGHEGMQIPAGFGAAEDKFAGPGCHEFDRLYPIPVRFQMAFFLLPGISPKGDAFSGNQFDGIAVQVKTVGHIRGGETQNYDIAFVDNDASGPISKPAGVDRNVARGGRLGYLRDTQRNQHSQFKAEENKKNRFFFAHFHKNMISGELMYLQLGKAEAVNIAVMAEENNHQAFGRDVSSLTIRVPCMC